jgi:hypothetical protein
METLSLEGDPLVTKWEDFKTLIKCQFYPIGYVEDQWICWNYVKKRKGHSVQEYTTEFKNMDIMLDISLKNPDDILKYLGRLHNYF